MTVMKVKRIVFVREKFVEDGSAISVGARLGLFQKLRARRNSLRRGRSVERADKRPEVVVRIHREFELLYASRTSDDHEQTGSKCDQHELMTSVT